MMLKFVVDAREDDVVGVTRLLHVALQAGFWEGVGVTRCVMRLLHVALTGFLGVLNCDVEVRCGC